ncbi:SIR2 family NAD-dependent protein deacylase [Tundrisphaera lichenicola]|uniref:SIR2 family NAD-dependent protein deacylase n=1 Tax=Tundrisphaera lichenicola TaxID=2029860 RepID=UPI003EB737B0
MIPIGREALGRAAEVIARADALLIGAGAGIGVDSGLPDFRGPQGFWKAYPPYAKLGLAFESVANPDHFADDPAFAWGFYGHRTNLYRATRPHEGFAILRRWVARMPFGGFVFTSNVDGHFETAGFDPERIVECHGSIEWRQCLDQCGVGIHPADPAGVVVDPETFRAGDPLPSCPRCGGLARPNILMFGDWGWDSRRTAEQHWRIERWLGGQAGPRLAILEFGAGRAVPTVRHFSERVAERSGGTLIRVNPRDSEVPIGQVSLPMGAREAIRAIEGLLSGSVGERLDQR